jgi:drug/metabolite transporter (DMT)-like permease
VQKHLSITYSAQEILIIVFGTAAVVLTFLMSPDDFLSLSVPGWFIISALGGLTVTGYWTFGEALKNMPASHVSTVAVTTPI